MGSFIGVVAILVLLGLGCGLLWLLDFFHYRFKEKTFNLFYLDFDLSAPSKFDEKTYRAFVKKHVKTRWKFFKLEGITFLGEATSVSLKDVSKLLEYLNKKRKDGSFIPFLEDLGLGAFKANFFPEGSEEIERWNEEWRMVQTLNNFYVTLMSETQWPIITLRNWNSEVRARFNGFEITNLPNEVFSEGQLKDIEKIFNIAYSSAGLLWKIKQVDAITLTGRGMERNSDEAKGKDFNFVLNQLLKKALRAVSISIPEVRNVLRGVELKSDQVMGLELNFGDQSGGLLDQETYRKFVGIFIGELRNQWPGDWKIKNMILQKGSIFFKRF